jgi:hypothetical protein
MSENREIETVEQQQLPSVSEITEPTTGALQRLEAEVAALDKAYRWALAMSKTTMVPEHFQQGHKPRGCTDPLGETATYNLAAAVLYGSEIGLSAMASAQNVFVVHGKPAVYARTMAAQVLRAGFKIEEVSASDESVIWRGLRDGHWASSEWTMERARQAGYTTNERYQTNPTEMLRAKATAEVCRIQYPDVLLGMAYSVEELQLQNVTVQRVVREGVRGTARLREIAEEASKATADVDPNDSPVEATPLAPQPTGESPPTGVMVVDPDCELATDEQLTRIRALGKGQGLSAAGLLEDITLFLQREKRLPDLHKLTSSEADEIIGHYTTPEPPGPETIPEPQQGAPGD